MSLLTHTTDYIAEQVCKVYEITIDQLKEKETRRSTAIVVIAKQVYCYLIVKIVGKAHRGIIKDLSYSSHSIVHHHYKRIREEISVNNERLMEVVTIEWKVKRELVRKQNEMIAAASNATTIEDLLNTLK